MKPTSSIMSFAVKNQRRLADQALKMSGILVAYGNCTVRRYKIARTDMKDESKELLQTIKRVTLHLDFPGEIDSMSTNTPFIEDSLPITVLVPWFHKCKEFRIDIGDEFDCLIVDEHGHRRVMTYSLSNKTSTFEEFVLSREFTAAPKRIDSVDLTDADEDGIADNPNTEVGKDPIIEIKSDYDSPEDSPFSPYD